MTIWIDIAGTKYTENKINDNYLKNIAYFVSKGGNSLFIRNSKNKIDAIYDLCKKRNIFTNNYEEYLRKLAYQNHSVKEDRIDELFDKFAKDTIKDNVVESEN